MAGARYMIGIAMLSLQALYDETTLKFLILHSKLHTN